MKITVRNTDGRLGTGVSAIEYTTQKDGAVFRTVRVKPAVSSTEKEPAKRKRAPSATEAPARNQVAGLPSARPSAASLQERQRQEAAVSSTETAASKAKRPSTASAANKTPSTFQLQNQLRQAQADQNIDTILRLNKQLKEERASRGQQTLGDRVSDIASAVFGGSGSSLANLAGFASNLARDPEADRRQIARLQESLQTGRTSDGRVMTDAQRKTIQDAISRLDASAKKQEAPGSFTNRAYRAADRMADTGTAFQESAKRGLGNVGATVVDAATSMGQSALDAALGAATGTGMLPFVARSLGGGTQEARRGGADLDEQLLYGSAQAAKEYVTEKLFGLSAPQRLIGGGSLDDAIETGIRKVTERLAKTPAGQKAVGGLLTWLAGGATEGLEEGIGSVIENTLINPNLRDWAPDERTRQQKFEDALYDMLVGGVSGLMGVTNLAAYQTGQRGADAHVGGTLNAMRRAAGQETAQEAAGARLSASAGTDTTQGKNAAKTALEGPRDVLMEAAARGGRLEDAAAPDVSNLDTSAQTEGTPVKAGRVTTIQRPYQGTKPVQAQKNIAPVRVADSSVQAARNRIEGARALSEGPMAAGQGFKSILKKSLRQVFQAPRRVEVDGVTFNGIPYQVEINKNVVGKVVNDQNLTAEKIALLDILPEVVKNGEYVGSGQYVPHSNKKKQSVRYDYFETIVHIGGKPFVVSFDVDVEPNVNNYRTHKLIEMDLKEIPSLDVGPAPTAAETFLSGPVEGTSSLNTDSTIPQGADSVKPEGIMEQEIRRLFGGGKRLSPDTLTAEETSAVEAANAQGTMDMDAENRLYQVNPEEHIDRRDSQSVGDKRVRAFQFDHPQMHPYYVRAAEALGAELDHYIPGGETASRMSEDGNAYSYRMARLATPRIAELIDRYGVKPSQIGDAIEAIIRNHGQENYAAAKRLEIMLDEMLTNGYQDITTGEFIGPNQDYIHLKGQIVGAVDRQADSKSGLDGIGAADAGSLNSDYERLQAQSSRFHPEGANAARPVDVPTQDFEGRNVSKAASTMMGAEILDDADVASLEQMVADGAFSYDTIRDQDALQKAQNTVRAIGFDRALERYVQAARANTAAKDNTVLGQVLMLEAARGGNRKALAEICSLYARNSTNVAQAMQAQRILRQLGPEARLYALQNSVNELSEKYGVDIELDQTALQDFMNAESEEARQEAEAALIQAAAKQLPTTFRAKYDAVRYLAMLGNPRTHIRNIVGNLAFQIPATVKNRVGAVAERGAQALGADVERTKSLSGANPFGALAREARADWANAQPFLEGSKYSEGKVTAGTIEQEAKPFQNSGKIGQAIGWAADKNGALLEAEDNFFKQWIYSQSLAGYLQANGVKSLSEADPALLNRARNYAAQEALRNTFNDKNAFSDFIAKAGSARNSKNPFAKGASYVVEGVLPFKRTPANVLARAVEYSPVGAFTDIGKLLYRAKTGKATQETVLRDLDRLAAGLSGSALLGLGALLSGMITGGGDEDKEQRNFNDLTGHQSYAVETPGGTSITLDWLAPSAIPFFMGVELAHAWQNGGLTPDEALNALKNIGEPMLEMSMLQGLNDVFEDAAYAQQHGGSVMGAALVSAATNYLTQVLPTVGGQLERTAENKRMTTYADKNSPLSKDIQFFLGKASQKVPGWDYQQIPYLDAWGREEYTGDPALRAFNNLANPAYTSQIQVNEVEKELQRVKDATGNSGVFPTRAGQSFQIGRETKNLTAEEYQAYAKKRGQTALDVLGQLQSGEGYQKLSDEKKAEAISAVYSYADAMGKMAVSDYRPGDGTVAAGALKTMLPPAAYILYKMNSDRDGDGKITNLESTQTLQELPGISNQERGQAWQGLNKDARPAKNPFTGVLAERGMSPEKSAELWGIYGRSGTTEEPYTEREKKRDIQETLGISFGDAAQVYKLMKKAAETK